MRIAIIGHGFVGKAVDYGFSNPAVTKKILDPKYGHDGIDQQQLVDWKPHLTFVCVPTPMNKNGSCNIDVVEGVIKQINT